MSDTETPRRDLDRKTRKMPKRLALAAAHRILAARPPAEPKEPVPF